MRNAPHTSLQGLSLMAVLCAPIAVETAATISSAKRARFSMDPP